MIDTHTHLDFPDFEKDREKVISRFFSRGGRAIINIGVDLKTSKESIELAEKYEGVYASVGLHPEYFEDLRFKIYDLRKDLKEIAKHKKVVAIGETGLDYFHVTRNAKLETQDVEKIKRNQKRGFLDQIEIAQELGLPVIVHCRNAWDDVFKIINHKSYFLNQKIVLHCYSGNRKDTERFLKLPNAHFSFSGNITYPKPVERSKQFEEVIKMIPLDKIMLDSDSPFLAPQEKRGQRNEPINVFYIAKKISEIKDMSISEVERATDKNAIEFFDLDIK